MQKDDSKIICTTGLSLQKQLSALFWTAKLAYKILIIGFYKP